MLVRRKELENLTDDMCRVYCKFPEKLKAAYKDSDDAQEALNEICESCPMVEFVDKHKL